LISKQFERTNRYANLECALGKFEVVVEATASYEWFVKLVEPLADRVILAQEQEAADHRREQTQE
jgi:hypothetical protein